MGLGDDKGVVPRFCDEMFACIQSKEKEQSNVIIARWSNINFLTLGRVAGNQLH